jgi:hypothetical protein
MSGAEQCLLRRLWAGQPIAAPHLIFITGADETTHGAQSDGTLETGQSLPHPVGSQICNGEAFEGLGGLRFGGGGDGRQRIVPPRRLRRPASLAAR